MTLLGFLIGLLLFAWAIVSGTTEFQAFVNAHGIAIVVGGVTAAIMVAYPLRDLVRAVRTVWIIFRFPAEDPVEDISRFASWADVIRRKGVSSIEDEVHGLPPSFLKDAMELYINGYTADEIKANLESAIFNMVQRERVETGMFKQLANFAPGFGLVGTLIGLIIMLRNMKDAASIAPSMATAMTATFYGVILANLVFLPISTKLARRTEHRVQNRRMIMDGVLMLYEKRPASFVLDKLNTYLPARSRIREAAAVSGGVTTGRLA